jgi:hypothetical protein
MFEDRAVSHPAKTRLLHVANGTATTRLIEAAGIPGLLSIWADPLYEGPVPGDVSDDELLDVRRRYLDPPTGESAVGTVNDLRLWRQTIEAHDTYDELVLWYEHDLFDQLNLIQLLTWIRERLPRSKAVSLVCIGSFPGHPRFKGLGELTPQELATLLDTRQRISAAQYALAEEMWRAFRSATPEALDSLRQTDTTALPYLAPAVSRFLQEYPAIADGLSRSERRLLRLAGRAPIDLAAAFPLMHEDEDVYYITDASLAGLAESLSATSPPLISLTRGSDAGGSLLKGTVTLTDAGGDVLAGLRDRVATCGIDRWLGGVHLHSGSAIWRWDDEHQRMTRTA